MRAPLLLALLVALPLLASAAGLYTPKEAVVELTAANFQDKVIKSNQLWLVEFYAPWCGHCKNLAPEWVKAAAALDGVVKIGAVNMDEHQSVGGPYGIQGFPTIKVFGLDKKKPTDYNGARTASAIVEFAMREANSLVKARLSGKKPGASSSKPKSSASSSSGSSGSGSGKVIHATESSFQADVIDNDDLVMVEFYAPWCGHCKNLEPEWKRAASQLGDTARMVAVDATIYQGLASKYGVRGYPTIKVFKPGKKDSPEDYNGGRQASDLVTFARNAAAASAKPRPLVQVTSQAELEEQCRDKASTCLVTFVPHILDGGAKARNAVLDTLKSLAAKHKAKPISYVWMEAGAQFDLEDTLLQGNTFYPAVAALNLKKGRFSPFVGSFTLESLGEFLGRIVAGREPTVPFKAENIKVANTDKWDGKDGKPIEEPKEL